MKDLRDLILLVSFLALSMIRLTKRDVDYAIGQAMERVGPEVGDLLEAPAMTEEEMEAAEQEEEIDGYGE